MQFEAKLAKTSTNLLRLSYKYFAVKLGITDEQLDMVTITKVAKLGKDEGGHCSAIYDMNDNLTKIDIRVVASVSDVGMIDVIAHEMVHAKQNFDGLFGFKRIEEEKVKWGFIKYKTYRRVRTFKGQVLEDTPYFEQICEQEAFLASRELTRQFLNFVHELEKMESLDAFLEENENRKNKPKIPFMEYFKQPGIGSL